ncbi:hypothetical protein DFH06DRAFT_771040 [Mycena polygramma]|nr:hypothetical protein DFH06DRAFT_771040 [Mycena polygramma]
MFYFGFLLGLLPLYRSPLFPASALVPFLSPAVLDPVSSSSFKLPASSLIRLHRLFLPVIRPCRETDCTFSRWVNAGSYVKLESAGTAKPSDRCRSRRATVSLILCLVPGGHPHIGIIIMPVF